MSRSIPLQPGHPSRSSKPSPIRIRPGISFEIETDLWQRSSLADRINADGTSAHRAPESLAESVRRTADRLDPHGLPGPFRDPQREASQANSEFLFLLTTTDR